MKQVFIICVLLSLVMSCTAKSHKANEINFKKAINDYLEKNPVILSNRLFNFPSTINEADPTFERDKDYLDQFVDLGFLTRFDSVKHVEKRSDVLIPKKMEFVDLKMLTYVLTKYGKEYYREVGSESGNPQESGFYCGRFIVDKIVRFSKPTDVKGDKVSEVQYSLAASDIQDWVKDIKDQGIARSATQLVSSMDRPVDATARLILTSNGWVYKKMYKIN